MRNYGLDNLKIFLTILVVVHHAAGAYTIGESFPVKDISTRMLMPLLEIDAAFFMGLFFFISGMFVPRSLNKYGAKEFIGDKVVRLLLPAILISILITPFFYIITSQNLNFASLIEFYLHQFTFGHGWFLVQLFLFSGIYIIINKMISRIKINFNSIFHVAAMVIALACVTMVIAIDFPINHWILFHTIEIFHFPQYIMMFFVGAIYSQSNEKISKKSFSIYLTISFILISIILINFFLYHIGFGKVKICILSALAVFLSLGLVGFFEQDMNFRNTISDWLGKCSFGIYIVHVFVVIILQKILLFFDFGPIIEFSITGMLGYLFSFIIVAIYSRCSEVRV